MAEALVEYDYKAKEFDELTIKKGDIITNISFKPGGWWEGTLLNDGKRGMFPDNFVKLIKTEDGVLNSSSSGRRCKVLFPYKPANEDELELQVGDIIDVISEVEEGWWRGSLKNRVGVFPSNFVAETDVVKPEREAVLRKSKVSRDESLKTIGMSSNTENQAAPKSDVNMGSPDLPALPPKPAKEYCRVSYKYEAGNADELTLHPGDIITIITKEGQDPGWWKGELKGKTGFFPDNFVEMITFEEATKTELKTKVSNRLALSKSATTSSISDSVNSISRKFSDSSRTAEDKIPPSVSKKPVLPPPPNKKLTSALLPNAKMTESSSHSVSQMSSAKVVSSSTTTTIKQAVVAESNKWSIVESSADNADGITWSSQRSYSLKNENKSSENTINSVSGLSISSTESTSDLNLDMVGRSSTKLTHPTATRAKAPKRRPPSQLINKEDLKNGDEEDEEEDTPEDTLMNGDAEGHTDKPNNVPPPWVEELKLSQAKKSMQGKTRVMIGGMTSSTSERSVSEKSVSEKSISEKTMSEKILLSEKSVTEKTLQPENKASSLVTLRQQPVIGQRPQSMIAGFKSISSHSSTDLMTITSKQWNDMVEKVAWLESNFESLTKAVKDLTGKLDDERQRNMIMQQELEKLTDLVTQV